MRASRTENPRDLIEDYVHLTKVVLPKLAQKKGLNWPVSEDHCFQRIVLDTVCGGVWYVHLNRPAYKHLTQDQAELAVLLCHDIVEGRADLWQLNAQSLIWRRKRLRPSQHPADE